MEVSTKNQAQVFWKITQLIHLPRTLYDCFKLIACRGFTQLYIITCFWKSTHLFAVF